MANKTVTTIPPTIARFTAAPLILRVEALAPPAWKNIKYAKKYSDFVSFYDFAVQFYR